MNIQAKLFAATVCFALSAQANAGPERGARTGSFSRSAQRAELSQKQTVDGATRMAVHNGARVTGTVASRGPGISVSVGKKAPYAPGAIVAAGGHFAASGPLNRSVVKPLSPTKGSVIGSRNSGLNTPNSPFANISAGRRFQTNPSEYFNAVIEPESGRGYEVNIYKYRGETPEGFEQRVAKELQALASQTAAETDSFTQVRNVRRKVYGWD